METITDKEIADLAADIQCGTRLARELLTLAGGDQHIVRKASESCQGIGAVKAYIIDHRFQKNGLQ